MLDNTQTLFLNKMFREKFSFWVIANKNAPRVILSHCFIQHKF
jgi:hypothetical protein